MKSPEPSLTRAPTCACKRRFDPAFRTGGIDFSGVRTTVNPAHIPEVGTGLLVHAGFAISRIDREEASSNILGSLRQMAPSKVRSEREPCAIAGTDGGLRARSGGKKPRRSSRAASILNHGAAKVTSRIGERKAALET